MKTPCEAIPIVRIIPRLDVKGPNLVKGIHLEGLRVIGKPEHFARQYYASGADELLFIDVVASLYGRNSLIDIIERTSKEIFIPLSVGGGLRSIDDIRLVLRAGADKVCLNTSAVKRPEFIREAAQRFGSSTVVISIEAIKRSDGKYEAYTDNGRERTGLDAVEWARRVEELGAGEILVTSIDREGTGEGFDLELIRTISESVSIPVIACGGAGSLGHIFDAVDVGKIQAVSIASILHYHLVRNGIFKEMFAEEINIDHLRVGSGFSKVQDSTIPEIKNFLCQRGVDCRRLEEVDLGA